MTVDKKRQKRLELREKINNVMRKAGITEAAARHRISNWDESRWYELPDQPKKYYGKTFQEWSDFTGYGVGMLQKKFYEGATKEEMAQKKPLPTKTRLYYLYNDLLKCEQLPEELKKRVQYELDN